MENGCGGDTSKNMLGRQRHNNPERRQRYCSKGVLEYSASTTPGRKNVDTQRGMGHQSGDTYRQKTEGEESFLELTARLGWLEGLRAHMNAVMLTVRISADFQTTVISS